MKILKYIQYTHELNVQRFGSEQAEGMLEMATKKYNAWAEHFNWHKEEVQGCQHCDLNATKKSRVHGEIE